jgi:hypothetical protein
MSIIGIGVGIPFMRCGGGGWTPSNDSVLLTKLLFWGKYSEIAGGVMPNKIDAGVTSLTVAGSVGSETYKAPDVDDTFVDADAHGATDYIWFKTDETQRTTTTAELIGYDFARTLIKYDNTTPYQIREIIILADGATLTTSEENNLRDYMNLSIWWSNVLSSHGDVKGNRGVGQSVWTPEAVTFPTVSTATIEDAAKANVVITFNHTINTSYVPATTDFVLAGKTISTVGISGAVVTLTVSVAYAYGDVVTVNYTKPVSNYLRDNTTGGAVASFTGQGVTNHIANPLPAFPTGCVDYWTLDEPTGNLVNSVTPGTNDGVPSNITQNVAGIIGNACQFINASHGYINCGVITTLTAHTVSLWAKRSTIASGYQVIFAYTNGWKAVIVYENGDITLLDASGSPECTWSAIWTDKTSFHHLIFKLTTTNFELYFDNSSQGIKVINTFSLTAFVMGKFGNLVTGSEYGGIMDEVGIFNKGLSPTEIGNLYNSGAGNPYH